MPKEWQEDLRQENLRRSGLTGMTFYFHPVPVSPAFPETRPEHFEDPRPAPRIPDTGRKSAPANAASTKNDATAKTPLPFNTSAESARSPLGEHKYAADECRDRPVGSAEYVKATEEIGEFVQAGDPPSPQGHKEDYSPVATLQADVDEYKFRPYKKLPALPPPRPSPKSTSRGKNTAWLPSSLSRTPALDPISRATDAPDDYFGEIRIGIGT